ncbi:MAG: LEPR-XLL domain-containing protein, partial [Planctomycetaceae bacterium]|nr:LEPR-XLL domain-containing protein [Planctomycetaceae bacterium]
MNTPSSRSSLNASNLFACVGQPFSLFGHVRDAIRAMRRGGPPARARRAHAAIGLEPMEPRMLLAANISYDFQAAHSAFFLDGDPLNNTYTVQIVANGTDDVLQVLAEGGQLLADGVLDDDGVNILTLTGEDTDLLFKRGDQYNINFSNLAGQTGGDPRYDIRIITDGGGVIPLIGQDDKVTIIGDGGYELASLDVQAKEDVTVTGKVFATGDITIKSSALDDVGLIGDTDDDAGDDDQGLLFTADSSIT